MLFMGFTSSHVHGLAAGNLPSFETLPGYTDATPDSYFAHGTAMHLSHIAIDLQRWYEFSPQDRLKRMFHPRRTETDEVLSPDQSPATSTFKAQRDDDVERYKTRRPQRADAVPVPGRDGHHHRLRAEAPARHGVLPAAGLQHGREPVRLLDRRPGRRAAARRRALHRLRALGQHFEKMRLEMDSQDLKAQHGLRRRGPRASPRC